MKKPAILLACIFLAGLLGQSLVCKSATFPLQIEDEKEEKKEDEEDTSDKPKESDYVKLLKNPEQEEKGFVDIYYVKNKLYFEVPFDLMGKPILLGSTISKLSDNNNGYVGTKPFSPIMVEFSRVDSTIQLRRIVKNKIAPETDSNISSALEKNSLGAIMELFDIKAYNPDTTGAVIEVTNFFLKDIKELSPFGGAPAGYTRSESFKKDRSFIGNVKSFDDNLMVKSIMSYEYSLTKGKTRVLKNKPFTAEMTRTLLLLPEEPVRPRIADPRIGIFVTKKLKFTNEKNRTEEEFYAHRFNLVPSDTTAFLNKQLVEPVKPIVFYVDNDFPKTWRATIKNAVTDWNKTFEKIGFKNAVKALDYPDDNPEFDPDNLKYNCIRYSPTPIANAMGPSWVDPRSGEIINASVYVFHDVVKLVNRWLFVQLSPSDEMVRNMTLPDAYRNRALRYVIRHEVGHCLGFMHNMGSSAAIPVDSLRSPSFTQKYGTTYSIMDYARFNYIAQPGDKERGVQLFPPEFGLYDYYLVNWNYSIFPEVKTKEEESIKLQKIISEKAGDVRFRYGKQQGGILDPSSQSEDLGDDAVKASVYGIKNLKYIMNHLNEWIGPEDKDYEYRQSIWTNILTQYVRYINHIFSNVGGIYLNEKYEGDPRSSYESVPRVKQEESLKFLLNEVQNLDWIEDKNILQNMPLTGTPAKELSGKLIKALLQSVTKVNLSAEKSNEVNPYTSQECMDDIYEAVWHKTIKKKALSEIDKEMQKAFIGAVISGAKIATGKSSGKAAFTSNETSGITLPAFAEQQMINEFGHSAYSEYFDPCCQLDTKPTSGFGGVNIAFSLMPSLESLYYSVLVDARDLLEKRSKSASDDETRLHYQLLLFQIDKVLN